MQHEPNPRGTVADPGSSDARTLPIRHLGGEFSYASIGGNPNITGRITKVDLKRGRSTQAQVAEPRLDKLGESNATVIAHGPSVVFETGEFA
jgi:hypothetical protein